MRFLKVGAVVFGALIVSTLGISATDALNGSSGSLLGMLVATKTPSICPADMLHIPTAQSFTCVDVYEASPASACPKHALVSALDTQANLNESTCGSTAAADVQPWTYVTREQASTLCARSGKRLPTAAEWYMVAIGTPDADTSCNVESGSTWAAGSNATCKAATGIYDAVGNVWEWVTDDVHDGELAEGMLPPEGYVSQVDSAGVPSQTSLQPSDLFYGDYLWSDTSGVYGMLRGGYYGNRDDAGVYAVQAKTLPTSATVAIGFRCVR